MKIAPHQQMIVRYRRDIAREQAKLAVETSPDKRLKSERLVATRESQIRFEQDKIAKLEPEREQAQLKLNWALDLAQSEAALQGEAGRMTGDVSSEQS